MVPRIFAVPTKVSVLLMVILLLDVRSTPLVILSVGVVILLARKTELLAFVLLMVSVAKVLAPVSVASFTPVKEIVLLPAVKMPLLVQLPFIVCVKVLAANVVLAEMVRSVL